MILHYTTLNARVEMPGSHDSLGCGSHIKGFLHNMIAGAHDQTQATDLYDELRRPRRVFVSMEGGGAKGLVHVAALSVLEQAGQPSADDRLSKFPRFQIEGVAGTSIGALIAALYAAGYRSGDFLSIDRVFLKRVAQTPRGLRRRIFLIENYFDRKTRWIRSWFGAVRRPLSSSVLAACDARTPTEFFGTLGWFRVRMGRVFLRNPLATAIGLFLVLWAALIGTTRLISGPEQVQLCIDHISACVAVITGFNVMFVVAVVTLLSYRLICGLTSTDTLKAKLNTALWKVSNRESQSQTTYRFCDIPEGIKLRIIATNLDSKGIQMFSEIETPETSVSDVVGASIAIPVVFKPSIVGSTKYFDGGLVSNVPAWTFDTERSIDPDVFTVSIETGDLQVEQSTSSLRPLADFNAGVFSALFGGKALQVRNTRSIPIMLETDLNVLDFDASEVRIAEEYLRARDATIDKLIGEFGLRKTYQSLCAAVHRDLLDHLSEPRATDRIRVAIARRANSTLEAYKVVWAFNYETAGEVETDDRLLYTKDDSWIGPSLRAGGLFVEEANDKGEFDARTSLGSRKNRYRKPLLWSGQKWRMSIPVQDGGVNGALARYVVLVDGNFGLGRLSALTGDLKNKETFVRKIHSLPFPNAEKDQ